MYKMPHKVLRQILMSAAFTLAATLISACSSKQSATNVTPVDARDTVIGNDIRAMDKARAVQDTLNKDKANTDAAIDSATDSKLPTSTD